jgi:hypothetical protein
VRVNRRARIVPMLLLGASFWLLSPAAAPQNVGTQSELQQTSAD